MSARRVQVALSGVMAGSLIAGVVSYRVYAPNGLFGGNAWVDALYASLQLFALELPRLAQRPELPVAIDVLRFVSPLATAGALVSAFADVVRTRIDVRSATRWSGHHVVCGASRAAVEIAVSLSNVADHAGRRSIRRSADSRVVVLCDSLDTPHRERLRAHGIRVVLAVPGSREFERALRGAGEVIIAESDDSSTLRWATAASSVLRADQGPEAPAVQALLHQPIRGSLSGDAGLGHIDFGSVIERVAQGAVSIVPLRLGATGPPRAIVVSNGDRAGALARRIRASTSDPRPAVIDVVGPGVSRTERDAKGLPSNVEVHDVEWWAAADRVISCFDNADAQSPVGSPLYVWTGEPAVDLEIALRVLTAVGELEAVLISEDFDLPRVDSGDGAGRLRFVDLGDAIARGQLIGATRTDLVAAGLIATYHRAATEGFPDREGEHALGPLGIVAPARVRQSPYFDVATALVRELDTNKLGLTEASDTRLLLLPLEIAAVARCLEATICRGRDVTGDRARFFELAASVPSMLEFLGLGLSPRNQRPRGFDLGVAGDAAELIAARYHRRYLEGEPPVIRREGDGWAANLGQALDYPLKLAIVGYDIVEGIDPVPDHWISDEQVEYLAEVEHRRWCRERRQRGWRFGPQRDNGERIHPDLRPYDQLSEPVKEKDRLPIRDIPLVLNQLGLTIVPFDLPI